MWHLLFMGKKLDLWLDLLSTQPWRLLTYVILKILACLYYIIPIIMKYIIPMLWRKGTWYKYDKQHILVITILKLCCWAGQTSCFIPLFPRQHISYFNEAFSTINTLWRSSFSCLSILHCFSRPFNLWVESSCSCRNVTASSSCRSNLFESMNKEVSFHRW